MQTPKDKRVQKVIDIVVPTVLIVGVIGFAYAGFRSKYLNKSFTDATLTINLFPKNAESKNYRVEAKAEIRTEPRGLFSTKTTYDISRIYWPNGGSSTFDNMGGCLILTSQSTNECTDDEYRDWRVELVSVNDK